MNGSQQIAAAAEPGAGKVPWRQALAILVTAVALGLVYNVASPLGVRAPKPESQAAGPLVNPNTKAPPPTAPDSTNAASTQATPAVSATNSSASALRWIEVKPLLATGQIVLVDGRAKTAYDIEHIPGAVSLPAEGEPPAFLAFAVKYPKSTPIVTYCGSDNCDLSHELAEKLRRDLGFTNVREMPGGIAEWRVAEAKSTPAGSE